MPFLYGSGVIPARLEEFKEEIKALIMTQFFTDENLDKFLEAEQEAMISKLNPDDVAGMLDYDKVFEAVVQVVLRSPVGGIVGMVGGGRALDPIKEPLTGIIR
ncbi:MAG: hypothetical protein ACE5LU_06695 [Anaerolineae bacterium]